MRKSVVFGASFAAALAVSACQDQATAPLLAPDAPRFDVGAEIATGIDLGGAPAALSPASRFADFAPGAAAPAINPADYVCSSATPVTTWLSGRVTSLPAADLSALAYLVNSRAATNVLVYEALFFQTTATPQTFGYNGEYTQVLRKTEKDIKRFWDIPNDDIQLLGLHGTTLQDTARVAKTYREVYGLPPATATLFAAQVRARLLQAPTLRGGNHPYFTFNAFAYSPLDGSMPDKVIIGDGVLEGYAAVGFADVAPQAIFAHEFAHQVQYERGYFDDAIGGTTAPERTRYSELMADAFAAYFLSHARGGAMQQKRVEQFLQVFFNTGDCSYASAGHHGTPNQRLAAARLGFAIADEAQKQGIILSSAEVHARFVAAFPTLIAPDAR